MRTCLTPDLLQAGGRGAAGRSGLTRRRFWLTLALGVPLLATAPGPPPATAAVQGGAGYDYQSGPGARTIQGAIGFLVLPVRSAAATLAASRYMDSQDEDGLGGTAGVIAPFVPWLSGRAELSRLVGDDAYRAWRYRLGPQLSLTSDAWLYPYFLRSDDNRSAPLSAAGLDANLALTPRLEAQAGVSYATRTGDSSSGQGTAGITWTATPRLLLLAQAGVGRNSLLVTRSGPGGGGGVLSSLPIVGGRGDDMSSRAQTTEESAYETALSLGFRVLFP